MNDIYKIKFFKHHDGRSFSVKKITKQDEDYILECANESNGSVSNFSLFYLVKMGLIQAFDGNHKEIDLSFYNPILDQLFIKMDEADDSHNFSQNFWHMTYVENLVKILNDGYFYARAQLKDSDIPMNNYLINDKTKNIIDSNKSKDVVKFVRLYFRTLNGFNFYMEHKAAEINGSLAIVSIDRKLLYSEPYFLYNENAHSLLDIYRLNNAESALNFDFKKIYGIYMPQITDEVGYLVTSKANNNYLMSECLIKDKLSTKYINAIYFENEQNKKAFLDLIKENKPLYDKFANMCIVEKKYFKNY